jgi:hypothetical protein
VGAIGATVPQAPAQASPNGPALLYNVYSNGCADLPGVGPAIAGEGVKKHTSCYWGDNQEVDFIKEWWKKGSDRFLIRNIESDLCFDVPGYGAVPPGTKVSLFQCDTQSSDNQTFIQENHPDGDFWIKHAKSPGLCLDVSGVRDAAHNDLDLTLFGCSRADDHRWRYFTP